MNKRIKKIALQVAAMETDTTLIMYDDEIARFAELIIRECAVIANETLDPLDDYLIGNDILKHFGVLDE